MCAHTERERACGREQGRRRERERGRWEEDGRERKRAGKLEGRREGEGDRVRGKGWRK